MCIFLAIISFYSFHNEESLRKMKSALKPSFPWTKATVDCCVECGPFLTCPQLNQLNAVVQNVDTVYHAPQMLGPGTLPSSYPLSLCVSAFHVICIFAFTSWFWHVTMFVPFFQIIPSFSFWMQKKPQVFPSTFKHEDRETLLVWGTVWFKTLGNT